ncbi:MAG: hypothetical protein IT420_07145 [Candidatus Brocadia sp.]|nr:hypothetical protein [Candidatus Brocadia sp.]MDG5996539.1 hypothetical protein [Candidatus Brocadia sp.]
MEVRQFGIRTNPTTPSPDTPWSYPSTGMNNCPHAIPGLSLLSLKSPARNMVQNKNFDMKNATAVTSHVHIGKGVTHFSYLQGKIKRWKFYAINHNINTL